MSLVLGREYVWCVTEGSSTWVMGVREHQAKAGGGA